MEIYNKYIKYKNKYKELKNQLGGAIECDDKYYFFENLKGTCWMISILMILFSHEPQLLENLIKMTKDDYIIKFNKSNTRILFPHFTKLEDVNNIISFFNYLKKRFENRTKYNSELLDETKEKSYNEDENTCEVELLRLFLLLYPNISREYRGGTEYSEFYLLLLISYFISDKLYRYDAYMILDIINKPIELSNIIGMTVNSVNTIHSGHSMAFYKCKGKLMFCSNDIKFEYNWVELLTKINELNNKSIIPKLYLYYNKKELDIILLYNIRDNFFEFKVGTGEKLLYNDISNISGYISNKYDIINILEIVYEYKNNISNYISDYFNKFMIIYFKYESYIKNIISKYYKSTLRDSMGETALIALIKYKDFVLRNLDKKLNIMPIFRLLINNNINLQDNYNRTALMYSIRYNYSDIFSLLLQQKHIDINIQNNSDETALLLATKENNMQFIKALLNKTANQDIKDNKGGTPLIIAIYNKNIELIKLLLSKKPKDNMDLAMYIAENNLKMLNENNSHIHNDIMIYEEIKKLLTQFVK
jgi:ankyrin repeat protein